VNRQNFIKIWEIFNFYFIKYIMNPFFLVLFSFLNVHESQVLSFEGISEFLHIPFTALELLTNRSSGFFFKLYFIFEF
jgi:hypothetical protein